MRFLRININLEVLKMLFLFEDFVRYVYMLKIFSEKIFYVMIVKGWGKQ